jgi:polysaccharide pyruvyl transferase WcaK-like protein
VRIAFISPCGFGNLGDVAIQDTFIEGVRKCLGEGTEIVGITQNPSDTEHRHHVRAIAMDSLALELRPRSRRGGQEVRGESHESGNVRSAQRIVGWMKVAVKEVLHWGIAVREMRDADMLVVSGGGQLDDHWGGPWRVPYSLWKWSLVAKLLGKDTVFLSVGSGTIDSRLTRFFLRSALARARYTSFRDERTAGRVRSLGVESPRVVPDLAFGHEGRRAAMPPTRGDRPTVVISPIAFLDPVAWPAKDGRRYRANVVRTAELTRLLLERGFSVVLCTSDGPDIKSAEELYDEVAGTTPRGDALEVASTRTPTELLAAFADADVAIASRLHGVILANLAAAPAIALSYDWKVDEHMRTMGLERYAFPIGTFEPADVLDAVEEMLAERNAIAQQVADRCDTLATEVRAQFEAVFSLSPRRRALSADGT